jgi:hypothetical protein
MSYVWSYHIFLYVCMYISIHDSHEANCAITDIRMYTKTRESESTFTNRLSATWPPMGSVIGIVLISNIGLRTWEIGQVVVLNFFRSPNWNKVHPLWQSPYVRTYVLVKPQLILGDKCGLFYWLDNEDESIAGFALIHSEAYVGLLNAIYEQGLPDGLFSDRKYQFG